MNTAVSLSTIALGPWRKPRVVSQDVTTLPAVHFGDNSITLPGVPSDIESAVTLGLRPDVFAVAGESAPITATVEVTEQLGDETLVHAILSSGDRATINLKGQHHLNRNDIVGLSAQVESPMLFDRQGSNLYCSNAF